MNRFLDKLEELQAELFSLQCVRQYFHLREQIKNNEELNEIRQEISRFAKEMTQNIENDQIYSNAKDQYLRFLNEYDSHPLIIDYNIVKEEVYNVLKELKAIVE